MERYVPIKSERSLRRHKAAGARFQYGSVVDAQYQEKQGWYNDTTPYVTLRSQYLSINKPLFKETLILRAVYEETEE